MILVCCLTKTIYPLVRSPLETQTGQTRRPSSKLDRSVAMATVGVLFTKFKRGMGGDMALYWIYFHISKCKRDVPFLSNSVHNLFFNTLCAFLPVPLLQDFSGTLHLFTRSPPICISPPCKLNWVLIFHSFSKLVLSQESSWRIWVSETS